MAGCAHAQTRPALARVAAYTHIHIGQQLVEALLELRHVACHVGLLGVGLAHLDVHVNVVD